MEDNFFKELREEIQPHFEKGGSHRFDHSERVYNNALKISEGENVDLDIVKVASLLHDIAHLKEDNKEIKCHAEEGSRIAKEILSNTEFPKEKIEAVCHAIKVHRYGKGLKPETKEAEIIQDADRLDALGALCIGRVFSYHGKHNTPIYEPENPPREIYDPQKLGSSINHFHEKILKIKPETFKTQKAREIAKQRYNFIEQFIDRFMKEWNGEL